MQPLSQLARSKPFAPIAIIIAHPGLMSRKSRGCNRSKLCGMLVIMTGSVHNLIVLEIASPAFQAGSRRRKSRCRMSLRASASDEAISLPRSRNHTKNSFYLALQKVLNGYHGIVQNCLGSSDSPTTVQGWGTTSSLQSFRTPGRQNKLKAGCVANLACGNLRCCKTFLIVISITPR